MQHLLQPQTLGAAGIAAAVSALACYPQLALQPIPQLPVWFLEANLFVCAIILWGFVFAWHAPHTGRPVFMFKQEPRTFLIATVAGLGVAAIFHLCFDPALRAKFPKEYPKDLQAWAASVPFSFGLTQLFLTFGPCDWAMRLAKDRRAALIFAGLFAAFVQWMKIRTLGTPVSPLLVTALLATRFAGGFLAAWFYLRGGALLVYWWALLVAGRHLLDVLR